MAPALPAPAAQKSHDNQSRLEWPFYVRTVFRQTPGNEAELLARLHGGERPLASIASAEAVGGACSGGANSKKAWAAPRGAKKFEVVFLASLFVERDGPCADAAKDDLLVSQPSPHSHRESRVQ